MSIRGPRTLPFPGKPYTDHRTSPKGRLGKAVWERKSSADQVGHEALTGQSLNTRTERIDLEADVGIDHAQCLPL